jgi:hypothetical protein
MENVEMKKLPEVVETKFTELFAALHSATDDLKMAGAEACLTGEFSQVTVINDSCRQLQAFETDLNAIINSFGKTSRAQANERLDFYKRKDFSPRKSRASLRVTVEGKVIEQHTLTETFVVGSKISALSGS